MSKITADHLSFSAFVYVTQSTAYQVANNLEKPTTAVRLSRACSTIGLGDS